MGFLDGGFDLGGDFNPPTYNLTGGGSTPGVPLGGGDPFNVGTSFNIGPYGTGWQEPGGSSWTGGGGGSGQQGGGGGGGFNWQSIIPLIAGGGLGLSGLIAGRNKGGGYQAPPQPTPQQGPDYSALMAAYQAQMQQFQDMMNSMMQGMGGGGGDSGSAMPTPTSNLPQEQINSAVRSYLARQQSAGVDSVADADTIAGLLGLTSDEVKQALSGMNKPGPDQFNLSGLTMAELTGDTGAAPDLRKVTAWLSNKGVSGDIVQRIYNDLGGSPEKIYDMMQETEGDPAKLSDWLKKFEGGGIA